MAIWVIKDGQREGPYDEDDVRELMYEGTYTNVDPAIRDGQYDWSTLGQLLGRQSAPAADGDETVAAATAAAAEPPELPRELPPELPPDPPPMPTDAGGEAIVESPALADGEASGAAPMRVRVVDFDMPFGSMVMVAIKWALAALVATMILGTIAAIFWGTFLLVIAVLLRHG